MKKIKNGEIVETGNYECENCGSVLEVDEPDYPLPLCPECEHHEYKKVVEDAKVQSITDTLQNH